MTANSFINSKINPESVHDTLKKYMLVDGFDMTLDLKESHGSFLYDSKRKRKLLDFFTYVSSNPIGMNHPKINNEEFISKIGKIALSKPSLSDIYPVEQAEFVETFFKYAIPDYFKYIFFIEGGALGVENAIKAAFDWKVRKNFKKGYKEEKGHQVIHFREAFHGRSGYTLSLTNTDTVKIKYFPKFNWPRITNPKIKFPLNDENLAKVIELENTAIEEIKTAIHNNKDDIAAILIEMIQGEGGDNHFRKEFFLKLREICDENEILFIIDEVQTGIAITGKWWAHMHYMKPDIISFGKKTQVCGCLSTSRIDEIEENVFKVPGRINSTWGGNIVDMYRMKRIIEIIVEDNLVENCEKMGNYLKEKIKGLTEAYPEKLNNPRGLGLFCAFDAKDTEMRNKILKKAVENNLLILGCGTNTVRFRPTLCVTKDEIDMGIEILDKVMKGV
ncbi:MAG: L-lysine 6-transaminase [Ignavibacteria bacterium]|nr:L-lysine 6-transaminase [Ignavibacteria bacterium]